MRKVIWGIFESIEGSVSMLLGVVNWILVNIYCKIGKALLLFWSYTSIKVLST